MGDVHAERGACGKSAVLRDAVGDGVLGWVDLSYTRRRDASRVGRQRGSSLLQDLLVYSSGRESAREELQSATRRPRAAICFVAQSQSWQSFLAFCLGAGKAMSYPGSESFFF